MELPTVEEETEQEKVGRSFFGCEASTCIFISMSAADPGVRSGMLRGVARLVLVGHNGQYKKGKLSEKFDVIEL